MRTNSWKSVPILAVSWLGMLLGATPAAAQYWPNGYSYRSTITIDHTKVPNTDQTNFPVLISGTYSGLATTANGGNVTNANGYDIIFASDANGVNPLPFEQESYNSSTGAIVYWVQLPTVSHTADTVFYLFYGNSSIVADQSKKTAVWDSNYKGVWHLPNGSSLTANDSTGNGNNGTIVRATATTGVIDGAANFVPAEYIDVGNQPSLQITGNAITLETWVNTSEVNPTQYKRILVKEIASNANPYTAYALVRLAGSNAVSFGIATGGAGSGLGVASVSSLAIGGWTHVVGTYDGSNCRIYLNGTLDNQSAGTGNIVATNQNVVFGADTAGGTEYFSGSLDEVRISNSARSADWIATEYSNQSSPSTFYSVGTSAQGSIPFSISGLSSNTADYGASIIIEGTNFGSGPGNGTVSLNGTNLGIEAWDNSQIEVSIPYGASSGYLMVTINGQTAISPFLTITPIATPLAAGWSDTDIGPVGIAGSASYSKDVFTVNASGAQINGTADQLHFVYQPLSGDGTIVARITGIQGGQDPFAGVMIRETLSTGSTNAFTSYQFGQLSFYDRPTTGGSTNTVTPFTGQPLPYWVKAVRSGNTFAGYVSSDGINWTQVGTSQTINMAQNVYVGLAVDSQTNSSLATATFDSVSINSAAAPAPAITSLSSTTGSIGSEIAISGSNFGNSQGNSVVTLNGTSLPISYWSDTIIVVTLPTGATSGTILVSLAPSMNDSNAVHFAVTTQPLPTSWLDLDVGTTGLTGSATFANGVFTVTGAGWGISSNFDGEHFVYYNLPGDGTIVARLTNLQGSASSEVAGVIIRETLDPASTFAATLYRAGYIQTFQRTSSGANSASQTDAGATLPVWLKLVRIGNTFTSYGSPDGVNWVQAGTIQTISMAQNVYTGLFVSNGLTTSVATATFDNVSISTSSNPAPVITAVSATTGAIGSQVVISGANFGANQSTSVVRLNGALVTLNSWTSSSIIVTIPTGATSGPLLVSVAPSMNDSNAVNFTVTSNPLPVPWLDQDLGVVGVVGSATYASGTFTVLGAGGSGTFGTPDTVHFAYQPLSGDGTIVARVVSLQGAAAAQAGVMIRDTLDPSASNSETFYYESYILQLDRPTTGALSTDPQGSVVVTPPYWVKLIRSGSTLNSYSSADGVTWVQVGTSQTVTMGQNTFVGLAVSNRSSTALATATFDNVSITIGSTPFVTGVYPALGPVGTSVTITGSNFGSSQGTSTITFNGVAATTVTSWTPSQIVASVPNGTPSGAGPVNVTVNSIAGITNASFTAIEPVVSTVTPPAAGIGGTVTINGSGFGQNQTSSQVLFNGVPVRFNSWSDSSIVVNVPGGTTSGPVTVNVDGVVSNGVQFTVLEPLSITGVSTTFGPAGSSVTITGTGFGPTQSNSSANFLGATATVNSWSDTSIIVSVPFSAVSGPISVSVGDSAYFGPRFTLTKTVQLTDSQANQTTYTFAMIGGVWVPTNSQGSGCTSCTLRGQLSYTYDRSGNTLTSTDELGHVTTYTYDTTGNLLTVTVPINGSTTATTTYTYNSFGEVLTSTDPLGNVTTNSYDANGNLLSVTTPAPSSGSSGSTTSFTYDSKGELLTITDPLGHTTSIKYFPTGLIQTITDAQSNVTTYAYDSHGNRTSVTDALNHSTTFAYDAGDRLKTITYPDTTTTSFTYDTRGRRTSVTDQNGKTTTYAYDDADRLTSVTDAATNVTTYGYDTEDNLTSITDANSHTTSFAYDAFGRVTKTTFPSTLFENYAYDAVGNLTSKTDRKNQQITYTYDQLNRLTQKSYPDSSSVNYTYDNDSRLTQVTDPTGTYQFTFDNMGRLTNTTTSYAFLTGRNFTTTYGYDAASNRASFTDPESGATSYAYDTLNRLQTLTPPAAYGGGSFGFTYDTLSRRTGLTRPNAVNTAYGYDNLSRLLSVTHAKGGTTIDGASYTLDIAGNRTAKTDQRTAVATSYGYDNIYQLLSATQGATTTESYTYDPVGNRLSDLTTSGWSNNTSNELTSRPGVSYTFDNNGNTVSKTDSTGTTSYTWDFENRLTSVALPGTGGTVTFKYDPFGRRIYKSSGAGTSIFAYDGDNLIETVNSGGGAVARYSEPRNIDEPLAELRAVTASYYEADGIGSITSLTNSAGAVVNSYTYDSLGNITASTGTVSNPFGYTAREFDSETNLYYDRARYFDSAAGRFINEDPVGFLGGLNRYAYVFNSPVNLFDPSGFAPKVPKIPYRPCNAEEWAACEEECNGKGVESCAVARQWRIISMKQGPIVVDGALSCNCNPRPDDPPGAPICEKFKQPARNRNPSFSPNWDRVAVGAGVVVAAGAAIFVAVTCPECLVFAAPLLPALQNAH